jgi:hypothetical protein
MEPHTVQGPDQYPFQVIHYAAASLIQVHLQVQGMQGSDSKTCLDQQLASIQQKLRYQ